MIDFEKLTTDERHYVRQLRFALCGLATTWRAELKTMVRRGKAMRMQALTRADITQIHADRAAGKLRAKPGGIVELPRDPEWQNPEFGDTPRHLFYMRCAIQGFNETWLDAAVEWRDRKVAAAVARLVAQGLRGRGRKPTKPGYDGTREERQVLIEVALQDDKRLREWVTKNVKHDYLETLLAKKKIGDAQKRAGDKIRYLVETMGLAAIQAIDLSKTRVDTSGPPIDIRDATLDAGQMLNELSRQMDADKFVLVVRVCGYNERLRAVANAFEQDESAKVNGACSKRTQEHCGWLFRSGLMQAAIILGYATDKERQRYHAPITLWHNPDAGPGVGISP